MYNVLVTSGLCTVGESERGMKINDISVREDVVGRGSKSPMHTEIESITGREDTENICENIVI